MLYLKTDSTLRAVSNAYVKDLDLDRAFYLPKVVEKQGLHPGLYAFPVLGNLADAITTHIAINRGAVEANPIVRPVVESSLPLFYATKLGVGLVTSVIANKLHKQGNRRTAKVISIIGGATPMGFAIHNINVINKLP